MTRLLLLISFVLMMSGCAIRHPSGTVYIETHATVHPVRVHPHVRVHAYHKYGCYPCWKMQQHRLHYKTMPKRGHRHPHKHKHYR